MVAAKKQGMTNGDYVYIVSTISDIHHDQDLNYWWYGISGQVDQAEAEKAWRSVLTLVPRPYNHTKYEMFQARVIEKSKAFPWKRPDEIQNRVSMSRSEFISTEADSLAFAVVLGVFYCGGNHLNVLVNELFRMRGRWVPGVLNNKPNGVRRKQWQG